MRTQKIRIYPTTQQKTLLREWIHTSRYVYNRFVALVRDGTLKGSQWQTARNQLVTAKNNPNVQPWELRTPKDIRAGAVRDVSKAFKTCFTLLKQNNISHFRVSFRKRNAPNQSIVLAKSAVKQHRKKLVIYPRILKEHARFRLGKKKSKRRLVLGHDMRLCLQNHKWYLCVPCPTTKAMPVSQPGKTCALDPGVTHFQTTFDGSKSTQYTAAFRDQYARIARFQSLMDTSTGRRRAHMRRRLGKIYATIRARVTDLHYRVIQDLVRARYHTVLLPKFESQDMVSKIQTRAGTRSWTQNKTLKREILGLNHYKFQQRLLESGIPNVRIVNEAFTSKTCTWCGTLNHAFQQRTLVCTNCTCTIDRDVNGARNIYLKYMSA